MSTLEPSGPVYGAAFNSWPFVILTPTAAVNAHGWWET